MGSIEDNYIISGHPNGDINFWIMKQLENPAENLGGRENYGIYQAYQRHYDLKAEETKSQEKKYSGGYYLESIHHIRGYSPPGKTATSTSGSIRSLRHNLSPNMPFPPKQSPQTTTTTSKSKRGVSALHMGNERSLYVGRANGDLEMWYPYVHAGGLVYKEGGDGGAAYPGTTSAPLYIRKCFICYFAFGLLDKKITCPLCNRLVCANCVKNDVYNIYIYIYNIDDCWRN